MIALSEVNQRLAQYASSIMNGSAAGPRAALARALLCAAEPLYAAMMWARNQAYDAGLLRSTRLPRPVISVGNITSGGTGKTPIVRWLATQLRQSGRRVAVLARGYQRGPNSLGDEQLMLEQLLNVPGENPVMIRANPDRIAAGRRLLQEHPDINVLLLDDAFQHRRLARDFNLVLIDATNPFGFDHVLPRGLLREPLSGLRRASALVLTHSDQVPSDSLAAIESMLRKYNPAAGVYRAIHAHAGLRKPGPDPMLWPVQQLKERRWFAFCGIGSPQIFLHQLRTAAGEPAGYHFYKDHHRYQEQDLERLRSKAASAGAEVLITTEKDWAKLREFEGALDGPLPIWSVALEMQFAGEDGRRLRQQIDAVLLARPAR